MHKSLQKICMGCNSRFQAATPKSPGFLQQKQQNKPSCKTEYSHYKHLVENMSDAQRAALGIKNKILNEDIEAKVRKDAKLQAKNTLICKWCTDNRDGRTVEFGSQRQRQDIVASVPSDGAIAHVVDALDFPLSFDRGLFDEFGDRLRIIISRADLVLEHVNQSSRLTEYAMANVFGALGIKESKVHVVSAFAGWNLKRLGESLPSRASQLHLVGHANTGKTALAHTLCGFGSGCTWPIPFSTREPAALTTLPAYGSKTVIDTPSLPESTNNGLGVWSVLDPKLVRKVGAGVVAHKGARYSFPSTSAKPGQCVSIGGVVAIELPRDVRVSSVQIWPLFGGRMGNIHAYSSVAKVNEVCGFATSLREPRSGGFQPQFELDVSLGPSLAIRGLGFVHLKAFGSFESYKATVWALDGVQVAAREELLPWISTRRSTRERR